MEKGILCTGSVVRNILDGTQTVDRRPIKQYFTQSLIEYGHPDVHTGQWIDSVGKMIKAPWQVCDLLYVRETFCIGAICEEEVCGHIGNLYVDQCGSDTNYIPKEYTISEGICTEDVIWKPSIHMPKSAARIWLEVLSVRLERIQDISCADCMREGIKPKDAEETESLLLGLDGDDEIKERFADLWDSLYKERGYGWDENPWVWRTEFKQIRKG